ncbi:hypothetical protein FOZ60_004265 [Perkinsus olseni]|uniref:EF-hand domain-containing protein n=1 Tax=Perkinsus olseni TaxID=32597 RepID=A0A7J6NU79_PEROL|nr:hypothetical protein FOZ60_004265 [Perkinsus olseni]
MDPEPFTTIGNTSSSSAYRWDLDAPGAGWSPPISAYRPQDGDRSVVDSGTFMRKEATAEPSAHQRDTNSNAVESPLTSLAGAVPKMVDEALERAQSFLRDRVTTDQNDAAAVEMSARPQIAPVSGLSSEGQGESAPVVLNGLGREEASKVDQSVTHGAGQPGGVLDEKLRAREEEQRLLVDEASKELQSLSDRAARLETALEASRQRERELAQRVFEKRASDERSDAEQAPPDPRSQSDTLRPAAPSLAARPEDSNAFRGSSARESIKGGIAEDAKGTTSLPSSRPPVSSRISTSPPFCSAHGLPLSLWCETTQAPLCSRCEADRKGGYSYSLMGSPRAASSRSRAITEVCEAKLRMMGGSLRELESGKAAALEEEILRTDAKLEELGQLADAAARDLREDFEQAMELLQSTRRVKEHMLVDHRQQLGDVAERIAALRSVRDEGVKACEAADHAAPCKTATSQYTGPARRHPVRGCQAEGFAKGAQCSEKLARMKNEVLCDIVDALRQERSTHADTREYAVEVESLLEAYATEWEKRFDYACSYCGQVLEAALANEPYCGAMPGRKAHHWVPTDTAGIAEAKETARPQLPVAAASPRLKSQAKIRAISPMFRADSSVDGSPASHSARRRDDSPRIGVERTDSEILSIVGTLLREKFPHDTAWPFRRQSDKARKGILSRLELWRTVREELDTRGILTDSEVDRVMLCCDTEKNGVLEIDKFMKLFDFGDHQLDMR